MNFHLENQAILTLLALAVLLSRRIHASGRTQTTSSSGRIETKWLIYWWNERSKGADAHLSAPTDDARARRE